MNGINTGRLILGGLAAGLVINIVETLMNVVVLADSMRHLLAERNLPPMGGGAMGGYVVLAFALGLLIVWTYAAIRTRYGPGPRTALRAGLAVWASFYLLGGSASWLMGIVPVHIYLHTLLYTLPTMLAAGYVGGMVYKE